MQLLIALQVNLENAFCKICKLTQCVGKTTTSTTLYYNGVVLVENTINFRQLSVQELKLVTKLVQNAQRCEMVNFHLVS